MFKSSKTNSNKSLILFATAAVAIDILKGLCKLYNVTVVTRPDAPFGRHKTLTLPPIKVAAQQVGLHVVQPSTLAGDIELPPAEIGVVATYGKMLPLSIISRFRYGLLNVHPSLLPKYRGPSPVQSAIANGETETGVTIMKIDEQMDHGHILAQSKVAIGKNELYEQLNARLWKIGTELLLKTLPLYIEGTVKLQPQNHAQSTVCKKITSKDGYVDLEKDAPQNVYNKYRAFHLWPGVWFSHKGKRVKIVHSIISHDRVKLLNVQPEGKKPMSLKDFENGYGKIQETN